MEVTQERTSDLLCAALYWASEAASKSDLYMVLSKSIGMTDEEITYFGFCLDDIKDEYDVENWE